MINMDDILISGVTRITNKRMKQQGYQVTTNEAMVGATLRALAELLAEWLKGRTTARLKDNKDGGIRDE